MKYRSSGYGKKDSTVWHPTYKQIKDISRLNQLQMNAKKEVSFISEMKTRYDDWRVNEEKKREERALKIFYNPKSGGMMNLNGFVWNLIF